MAKRRGSALVIVALVLTLALAAGGLAIDLSLLLAARSRLQSAVDAAAIAAVLELDGTPAGIGRARAAAGDGARCEFWSGEAWEERPAHPAAISRVRVSRLEPVPLTVIRAFVKSGASHVFAAAAAGQQARQPSPEETSADLTLLCTPERIAQDSDAVSTGYARYAGNGRRLVASGLPDSVGAFLLIPAPECAVPVGGYLRGSRRRAVADAGYYVAELER